jgi:multidrug efflux pump subunit AcrA (membrane-fusion protein)
MLATATLPYGAERQVLAVPKDAVVQRGDRQLVYRISEAGMVEEVAVETGSASGAWIAVEGQLAAGDRVITRGNERLFPGQKVEGEPVSYDQP